MSRVTRSKAIIAEYSALEDSTSTSDRWRRIFATFLAEASSSLVPDSPSPRGHPYFYLLQSNSQCSLCLLTGLSVELYSALLLACKLVTIRNNADGSRSILVRKSVWDEYLTTCKLKDGSIGDAEFTDGYINTACIEGISADDNDKTSTSMKRMWVR